MDSPATRLFRTSILAVVVLLASGACPQDGGQLPQMGYVYPAGGQQGTTFEVSVGGQYLRGAKRVYVSGAGVQATVISYVRPLNNDLLKAIGQRLRDVRKAQIAARDGVVENPKAAKEDADVEASDTTVALPDHPLLRNLDALNPAELQYVTDYFFSKKRQKNAQIGELLNLEVTIDPGAPLGECELRIECAGGLTNPIRFRVGSWPEVQEREPNDPPVLAAPVEGMVLQTPFTLNGQILPGDVDRFWFHGQKGQSLIVAVAARALNPYLADAVPGWFQAVATLYGRDGRELAFQDDFRFDPDPVFHYSIPEDGDYALEIRDSIYRGREDFVYRVEIGETPFITGIYPLGAQAGAPTEAALAGWNLPAPTMALETTADGASIRAACLASSNTVDYAVDSFPEYVEAEPNGTAETAQTVVMPATVNGRIDTPGDADVFRFDGRAGEVVVAEVVARRLHSPVDSALYLLDMAGNTLAWNDDPEVQNTGLLTHHADAYLRAELPVDGVYFVRVVDVQHQGGSNFAYRLHIRPPLPDFDIYVTPSSLSLRPGRSVPVTLHAVRRDGFTGAIDVVVAGAESPFFLDGGTIPADRDSIRATLTARPEAKAQTVAVHLAGRAMIEGRKVHHPALPAEDQMQAFLYRHLVPSRQLLVSVQGARRNGPALAIAVPDAVRIPAGGTAEVHVDMPGATRDIQFMLSEAPDGVSLQEVRQDADGGWNLVLAATGGDVSPGFTDNLIVAASVESTAAPKGGAAKKSKRRTALGVLPAIPIEVVAP